MASDEWRVRAWLLRNVALIGIIAAHLSANSALAQEKSRLVHVFVALADNAHQGIVPVPKILGNGDDPGKNLYWGAAFGVRTYFKQSSEWKELAVFENPGRAVLERSVFQSRTSGTYLIADGYRGREIRMAIEDFLRAAAGQQNDIREIKTNGGAVLRIPARASLVVYVGHDGLMDFHLDDTFSGNGTDKREVIVLACASKYYFPSELRPTGAQPLLWTTGLMAPEAYTLKAALDGWIAGETAEQIRQRAAGAYAKYQKISLTAAQRLFSSGW